MAGRNSQVARLYAILKVMEGSTQGLTVREIHAALESRGHELGKRTVYRDLEALSQAGFPLFPDETSEDTEAARWKLEQNTKISQYLVLSYRELVALYLARQSLEPLKSTPFYSDLQSVFLKFEERLGKKAKEFFETISREIYFAPTPQWGLGLDARVLESVQFACSEGQTLKVHYSSASSKTERVRHLGPHFLYFAKGSIYLVAEDLEVKETKIFALPRMKDVEVEDSAYTGTPIDPEALFSGSLGVFTGGEKVEKIALQFSRTVSPYVRERRWHESQRIVDREGGETEVHLELSLTPELTQWVLGFGPEVRVLGPKKLQELVCKSATELLRIYEKKVA